MLSCIFFLMRIHTAKNDLCNFYDVNLGLLTCFYNHWLVIWKLLGGGNKHYWQFLYYFELSSLQLWGPAAGEWIDWNVDRWWLLEGRIQKCFTQIMMKHKAKLVHCEPLSGGEVGFSVWPRCCSGNNVSCDIHCKQKEKRWVRWIPTVTSTIHYNLLSKRINYQ